MAATTRTSPAALRSSSSRSPLQLPLQRHAGAALHSDGRRNKKDSQYYRALPPITANCTVQCATVDPVLPILSSSCCLLDAACAALSLIYTEIEAGISLGYK